MPTHEETQAINYYKGSGYTAINAALRNHNLGGPGSQFREIVDHIDTYIEDTPEKNVTVYRQVGPTMMQNIFNGLGIPTFTLKAANIGGKAPTGQTWEGFFSDWLGGFKFADNGFLSTSKSSQFAMSWGGGGKGQMTAMSAPSTIMRITGATKGVDFDGGYKSSDSEHEVLLPRGTRFQVTAARPKEMGGTVYLEMDVEIMQQQAAKQEAA